MHVGMSAIDNAEMKLKQRIRWSCMLHVVRDSTGEHEIQLMEEYLPEELDPNGELYDRIWGLFEATHKYCKKVLKDGLEVCYNLPSLVSPMPFLPFIINHIYRHTPNTSSSSQRIIASHLFRLRSRKRHYALDFRLTLARKASSKFMGSWKVC